MTTGQEWLVEIGGCSAERLRDARALAALFDTLVHGLELTVIGSPQWHVFPEPGGITGLALLSESHLSIHTFPEHGYAALNVYSCRVRPVPDFQRLLAESLGAATVSVREVKRGVSP